MKNPFEGIALKPDEEIYQFGAEHQAKSTKRDEIYSLFDPLVNEVLDMLLASRKTVEWKKGSDFSRAYCCHVAWFAGPTETHKDPYDTHHEIRRRIEITLDQDSFCTPTGFKITNYELLNKTIHVGLSRENLIHGIQKVMAA